MQPERSLSHQALFQVMLVMQKGGGERGRWEERRVSSRQAETEAVKFDIAVSVIDEEDCLRWTMDICGGAVRRGEDEAIGRAPAEVSCRRWSAGETSISINFPFLSRSEKQQLVVGVEPKTETHYENGNCLHTLFEQQVEKGSRIGDSLAAAADDIQCVERGGKSVYQLPGRRGLAVEERVGIRMKRSLKMVVALLGVMKAGGAYVPVDASYPAERMRYMLEDAQVRAVLSDVSDGAEQADQVIQIIEMEKEWESIGQESRENLGVEVDDRNLAT